MSLMSVVQGQCETLGMRAVVASIKKALRQIIIQVAVKMPVLNVRVRVYISSSQMQKVANTNLSRNVHLSSSGSKKKTRKQQL